MAQKIPLFIHQKDGKIHSRKNRNVPYFNKRKKTGESPEERIEVFQSQINEFLASYYIVVMEEF